MARTIAADPLACPDDATLLALVEGRLRGDVLVSLDAHLDACPLCREVVATLGSGPRPAGTTTERAEVIGRFVVLGPIGEGAMGIVYAAYDPELDRRVALKLVHADRGDERARARLVREAQAMARLSHPNAVTVYDVGTRDDEVYVAMELVEGTSLREWLAQPRSLEAILELFTRAGEGLAAAHDAGLVHRDFKPENVLVDARDRPKVGDFGLAVGDGAPGEAAPDGALLDATLTRTGALLGTPAYMAPEQLRGEAVDARADQFAFCVALWEALDGRRPFADATTLPALKEAIARGPAAPRRRLPVHVQATLRRGLASRPEDRFPDLRALLAALRPSPRAPWAWIAVGLASALGVGGALFALDSPEPLCSPSREALAPLESARAELDPATAGALARWAERWTDRRLDACEATHVRREQSAARMDRRMACLDRQRGTFEAVLARVRDPAAAPFAADAVEALPDPRACDADLDVAPPAESARDAVADTRRRIDEARAQLATAAHEEALARAEAIAADGAAIDYAPLTSEIERLRADALRALARYDEAEAAAERAVLAAQSAGDDRGLAEAWLTAARVEGERGRFTMAARHARQAEATLTRAGAPADLRDALLRLRGLVRTNLGELEGAEEDLRAALRSGAERWGPDAAPLAPLHTSLGNLYRVASRLDEALAEHERALAIDEATLGGEHPRVGRDLHNVAGVLRRLDRADEARERYERALAIKGAALGEDHPEVALTRNSLGLLASDAGDLAAARTHWEAAVVIFDAHAHGDAALVRFNLARLELAAERFAEARAHVEHAIRMDSARIGPRSKRVGSQHVILSRALRGEGRDAEARAAAEVALSIAREIGDAALIGDARALLGALDAPRPRVTSRRARAAPSELGPPSAETTPAVTAPATTPAPVIRSPRVTGSGAYGAGQPWE